MSLKIPAEDYKNDQTIDDIKLLYSGMENLPEDFWDTLTAVHSWKHDKYTFWDVTTPLAKDWRVNQFLFMNNTPDGELREYIVLKINGESAQIRTITDYRKHDAYGILARNREQNFALNALLDPDIDFVSLAGKAGSGKTLLSLAAGLEQTIEWKSHNRIIFTREAVALGKEQGFLPGNEEAKLAPWLGALYDNLEILTDRDEKTKGHTQTDDAMKKGKIGNPLLEQAISIKSLNYMQGRTLIRKIFIVDESQNITRDQAKQLITRAGPGTKVVFLGNLAQVATPYLSGTSSGLAYVVDRFKRYEYSAHITLAGTERSRLAAFAADNL
jgi:PhoH-like ATPase